VKLLIESGANVNSQDKNKMTPLHYNIENSKLNIELTKLLIEKGADINSLNNFNVSPLYISVLNK
jgi:ankyrin repeat protein